MTSRPTGKGQRVDVTGGDVEGHPYSYLKQVLPPGYAGHVITSYR